MVGLEFLQTSKHLSLRLFCKSGPHTANEDEFLASVKAKQQGTEVLARTTWRSPATNYRIEFRRDLDLQP